MEGKGSQDNGDIQVIIISSLIFVPFVHDQARIKIDSHWGVSARNNNNIKPNQSPLMLIAQ